MKKSIIFLLLLITFGFGLFIAIYYRQPLGFIPVLASIIAFIYFIMK